MRIALILLLATASVSAGELYKCKSATGEITFTNIKCPEKTEVEHYGSYVDEKDAPPPVEPIQPAQPAQPQAPAPMAVAPAPNPPAGAQPVAAAGYQCSANGKTWIQSSPCPATSTKTVVEDVDMTGMKIDGRPLTGTGTVERQQTVPVQQTELSKDEMCAMISMRANTSEKEDNGPSASYDRNRLRAALNCS